MTLGNNRLICVPRQSRCIFWAIQMGHSALLLYCTVLVELYCRIRYSPNTSHSQNGEEGKQTSRIGAAELDRRPQKPREGMDG